MKTKMFFLAGICAALAACSSDSDDVSSSPSNTPAILEVVSYKFVQEETDVVERVEYPVVVLQHKVNDKDEPLPMMYAWDVEEEENSLFVLTEGSLPVNAENLAPQALFLQALDADAADGVMQVLAAGIDLHAVRGVAGEPAA